MTKTDQKNFLQEYINRLWGALQGTPYGLNYELKKVQFRTACEISAKMGFYIYRLHSSDSYEYIVV